MNTCKDCIHYSVCEYHIDEETEMTVEECTHGFKHKDQYVVLPAYVGQELFIVKTNYDYDYNTKTFSARGYEIKEGKVSMIQQKANKSWKVRITVNSSVGDYELSDFGVYVFSTKQAAEEHIKTLEGGK
jgi:hypothetical protein